MASNHTTNYQLNQWAKSDRVMMDDFNADNAKIDAALKANADAIAETAAAFPLVKTRWQSSAQLPGGTEAGDARQQYRGLHPGCQRCGFHTVLQH